MLPKNFSSARNFSNIVYVFVCAFMVWGAVAVYSVQADTVDDQGLPIAPNNTVDDSSLYESPFTGSSPSSNANAYDDPSGGVQDQGILQGTPGGNDYDHTYDQDLGTPVNLAEGSGEPGGLGDPFAGSGGGVQTTNPSTGGVQTTQPPTGNGTIYSGGGSDFRFDNPLGNTTTIQAFISKLLGIVVQIAIPIAIFFIVYAGFLLTTARGNEEQLKRGKAALLWALVGSAVILAAQLLSEVIKNTINNL